MSEPRLSPATKSLLRAARTDGPSAAARAKVWSGVSGAVGGAAGAAGAASAAGATAGAGSGALLGTGGAKMLAMGTLLGGTVTVGLATVLLGIGPAPRAPTVRASAPMVVAASPQPQAQPQPPAAPLAPFAPDPEGFVLTSAEAPAPFVDLAPGLLAAAPVEPQDLAPASVAATPNGPTSASAPTKASHAASAPRSGPASNPVHVVPPSTALEADRLLSQEAALVSEARDALLRGDPHAALRAVKAARTLPSHRLAPEELAVESQALRALGREDDARDTDATLKKQFPDSALAR